VIILHCVRTVGRRSTFAAANHHEPFADEFVVGTSKLDVVQRPRAARSAAAIATARRAELETKFLHASTLAVSEFGRVVCAPRAATFGARPR